MPKNEVTRNIQVTRDSASHAEMRQAMDEKKSRKFECSTCAFYDEYVPVTGLCRRNAPGDFLPFPEGLHETGEIQWWSIGAQWPTVYPNDWCGEHSDLRGGVER